MGAKTWMLVYADGDAREALKTTPALNREASAKLASQLFPGEKLVPMTDGDLWYTSPPDDELYAGSFPGVSVVAAEEFGLDYPSQLPQRFLNAGGNGNVWLHAMHSVVDWFAFAKWENGKLVRSLSLSPDSGVLEDTGPRLPFEEPYWAGQRPAVEEGQTYPLPFHPLELGEAALLEFFGYQIEGFGDAMLYDPESIRLMRFKRSR